MMHKILQNDCFAQFKNNNIYFLLINNVFVSFQIELVSDDGESKRQRTKNVYDRNPVFNEEFVMYVFYPSMSIKSLLLSPTCLSLRGMMGHLGIGDGEDKVEWRSVA